MSGGFVGRIFTDFKDYATGAVHHMPAIDANSRAMVTVSSTTNNLARGEVFSFAQTITLENGIDRDYVLTIPAPKLNVTFLAEVEASDVALIEFFRDTVASGGTPIVPADLNDRTRNTAQTVIAADAVITDDGTEFPFETQLGFTGKGNDSFGGAAGGGLLLRNSTNYMLRITSLAAGNLLNVNITLIEAADRI